MQYTIRNIPSIVDRALRRLARVRGASLNDVALEALARGAGVADERVRQRNLRDLSGAWQDDSATDDALREQDTVDPSLWK